MRRKVKYRCSACGHRQERHANAKNCVRCNGALVRVGDPGDCCPTCGRPYKPVSPSRFCHKCKKPILRGHKFRWVTLPGKLTTVEHRNCDNPKFYEPRRETS